MLTSFICAWLIFTPEELQRVCRDLLDEARQLGISVPQLEAAAPLF
jgi:hypothetical protein